MVKRQLQRISLGSLFFIIGAISIFAQPKTMVSGKVISKEKQEVPLGNSLPYLSRVDFCRVRPGGRTLFLRSKRNYRATLNKRY